MLKDKLKFLYDEKRLSIGVLGLGKDGWQLACRMAMFGFCSLGYTIRPEIAESTNNGVNYLHDDTVIDNPGEVRSKLVFQSLLNGTTDLFSAVHRDIVFVCVSDLAEEYRKDCKTALKLYTEAIGAALRAYTVLVFIENENNTVSGEEITAELCNITGMNKSRDFFVSVISDSDVHGEDASGLLRDVIEGVQR